MSVNVKHYVREIASGVAAVGFVSAAGSVLVWSRYGGTFRFALSNNPGVTSTCVDYLPQADTLKAARIVANAFFAPRLP